MLKRFVNAWYGGFFGSKSFLKKLLSLCRDKRERRFFKERFVRGFSDDETWNLDFQVAKFLLPKLARFREIKAGHPADMTQEQWNEIVDKMIFAMREITNENCYIGSSDEVVEGCELFGKYFHHLWW